MAEPFLGQIMAFGGSFAPAGWAICNGAILSVSQYTALFSLLGTYYGGNGSSTFALPDLQGRVAIGTGQGTGLSNYSIGQKAGSETVTLSATQLPAHTHPFAEAVSHKPGTVNDPTGAYLAVVEDNSGNRLNGYTTSATGSGANQQTGAAGGSQPFQVIQPYLAITYCIALVGIYPSRN